MILKPRLEDLKAIGYYLGKIILGLSLTMLIPVILGIFKRALEVLFGCLL